MSVLYYFIIKMYYIELSCPFPSVHKRHQFYYFGRVATHTRVEEERESSFLLQVLPVSKQL